MSEKKYGPNTAEVDAYLAFLPKLTDEQWAAVRAASLDVARAAARNAALDAARTVAWDAARATAWVAAWETRGLAAWAATWAAVALVVRDLITPEQFDTLTTPMRAARIDFDTLTTGPGGSE